MILAADTSSWAFAFTLVTISVTVLLWSYYYIDSETDYRIFLCLLLIFLFSIFLLVFAADLLRLFVAWDLLGFTSFFLVVYYRSRVTISGGLLTGLTNRLGDVILLIIFGFSAYGSGAVLGCSFLLLLWVSFTKSAQVPFSSWLPAAMLAPTPVSALVHSSTLVTAGVYLLYRFGPLSHSLLTAIGVFTTLIAGLAASSECDIKKIIALSTLSHLGLIITSLGLYSRSLTFSHLNIHAAFKALLFLAVGTAIHTDYGSQESRSKLALGCCSPTVLVVLVIALSSNIGLVYTSGFASKEAILGSVFSTGTCLRVAFLFYLGIALTLAYSIRLVTCLSSSYSRKTLLCASVSVPIVVKFPLGFLRFLTVIQGWRSSLCFPTFPWVACFSDIILVFVVFGLIGYLSSCFTPSLSIRSLPSSSLLYCTSGLSRSYSVFSGLQGTEVQLVQGFSLGLAPTIFSPFKSSLFVLGKALLLIRLVFVLV